MAGGAVRRSPAPEDVRRLQESTGLTDEQITRLYKRFATLDPDSSGSIAKNALQAISSLSSKPLLGRVLALVGTNESDKINFVEFAQAFAMFLPQTDKRSLLRFIFMVYDVDGDGKISSRDLLEALKLMVGPNMADVGLQQIVDKTFLEVGLSRDGHITFDEFEKLSLIFQASNRLDLQI
ncbi:EF hand domain [Trypanosoma vivax]|uniref:Putative calcineurin B subunit n=1 Tax=Trypanosoma vivax (strain Y486) TaxID=1055687 RepID=G0U529_TRYVY|nr:putative calcineurin B subunit [Trypanosoma vivax]KAH8616659.1 EF hand domain [Trypanosoma vivax]CCC50977.1 putative calcineurin B subunit [Trypanosoma vivax Y486]